MKWSTTPPDRPGFYWVSVGDAQSIALFRYSPDGLVMDCDGGETALVSELIEGLKFAGPIPEPQEAAR